MDDKKFVVLPRSTKNGRGYEVWEEDLNVELDIEKLTSSPPTHPVVFMTKEQIVQAVVEWHEGIDENDPDYPSDLYDMMQYKVRQSGTISVDIDTLPVRTHGMFPSFMGLPTGMSGIPSFMGLAIGRLIERILDDDDVDNDDGFKGTASLWGAKQLLEIVENLEKLFAYQATIPAKRKRAVNGNNAEIKQLKADYETLLNDELGGITFEKYKGAVCSTCNCPQSECPVLSVLNDTEARMKILFPEG